MKKKLMTGIIATLLFASPIVMPTVTEAASVQELEDQKAELENKSSELNSKIQSQEETLNNLESEKVNLESEVEKLQTDIDAVVLDLKAQEQKLADSKAKIEKLKAEIEKLKELIARREEKLEHQARSVQTDGSASNMVDLVLSADSLSDLIGRVGVVNQLVSANKEIVTQQENDKKEVEKNEEAAQEEKVAVETLKAEIEVNKSNLVAQKAELDDKIVQVATKYDMTESEKNEFVKAQAVVATKTSVLSSELQEERQRIIAEEEKAQAAAKQAEAEAKAKAEEAEAAETKQTTSSSNSSSQSNNSAQASTPSSSNSSGFIHPSGGYQTSSYGYRIHPITGVNKLHGGIDFGGGGPIVAAQSGTVVFSGYDSSWGYYVKIDHGNGLQTLYAHMVAGSLLVTSGQQVSQGQQIGTMGTTGSSTGVHLHFEVYVNGSRVDPANYL
ncbi:murein hydrolase activator EnvC family protein [Carnobacterium inhibens]|uniref:Peptidase M48 n=2 Tax=Carnobacterium inhibens TaxID=147709 RepID=U5S7K9_9LACT|nr:M23 family metallopeptidase [Carnobacterium inhibens]AGY81185.1 peptidase M48 [Carnobacterium inhibens subsp. gilichinskyi]MBC9826088.1 peptidoglycan DD-metalloendopeptidase family protein [Carnobacterium inhibens]MCM3513557.1 peptidoglycan DD-metalloendopeptidase family protein [Carnobacterium inhibens]